MSDRDALLRAICEYPDDDTPRLVFADWLQEHGDEPRAEFVRAQVELARTPAWEPFAVECRWLRRDVVTGRPFRHTLPPVDGFHLEWPALPFRRGFGWALNVRTLSEWPERAEPLFDAQPIGKVTFWTGTLDDWKRVAASPHLGRLRDVTFVTNPIEPLFALRDVPAACGIADVRFQRADGTGMPEVVEALVPSPLGRAVRGLHFRSGDSGSLPYFVEALAARDPLDRLSFALMGLTAGHVRALFAGPVARGLTELRLADEPLGDDGLAALADELPPGVKELELVGVGLRADGLEALSRCDQLSSVRRLCLARNPLTPRAARILSLSRALAGLRSLDLSGCRIGDRAIRHVVQGKFWPNLVELDLRGNPISAPGARRILDAPAPPDLAALVLDGEPLGGEARSALVKRFGPAVVFDPPDPPA